MKAHFINLLPAVLAALLTACNLPAASPAAPTSLPPAPTAAPTTPPPALTVDQALNAVYTLAGPDDRPTTYALQDGSFQNSADPATFGYTAVFVLREQIALGDLNGDGWGDAVVPVGLNFGGTGQFIYLAALLNQGGQPVHAAANTYGIGDRTQVQSLAIERGKIYLEAIIAGVNDPACCGATPLKMTLEYDPMGFRVLHLASGAADGRMREVTITSPAPETLVSAHTTLSGSTSIGPFENTLVYTVYGPDGMAVAEAGFQAQNAAPGEPAAFSLPLDFSAWNLHGRIRVSVAERSAADGSVLMSDSVYLVLP